MKTYEFLITKNCNLACSYCYIDQEDVVMSKDMVDAGFRLIDSSKKPCKVSIFGGEPTLEWDLVNYIGEMARAEHRREYVKEVMITTNGTNVDDSDINALKAFHGINVFVSYDGVWDHKTRKSLEPTFLDVEISEEQMIKNIKASSNKPNVMVSPSGMSLSENYDFFMSHGIIPNFKLVRDAVWTTDDVLTFKREFAMLVAAYKERFVRNRENCPPGILKEAMERMISCAANKSRTKTCGCGYEHITFSPDGKHVYPCARFESLDEYQQDSARMTALDGGEINRMAYASCDKCPDMDFCEKPCVANLKINDFSRSEELCDVFRFIHHQMMLLNRHLRDDKMWQKVVMKVIDGGELDG